MRNRVFVQLFLIMILLLFSKCIIYEYKNLTCYQQYKKTIKLKTSGYYFYKAKDMNQCTYYSLYDEGSFFYYGTSNMPFSKIQTLQKECVNDDGCGIIWWGAYIIEGDTIKIQKFWPDESHFPVWITWRVCTNVGVILNDSTFRLDKVVYHDRIHKINETYHFRPCVDCKPDSSKSIINVHLKRLGKRRNYWISPLFTRKVK